MYIVKYTYTSVSKKLYIANKKGGKMVELLYEIHFVVVNYRPIFYITGSFITLFIMMWMLNCEVQNDSKK